MEIRIPAFLAHFALWVQQFTSGYIVVCRGYNEDDANFTELVWQEDKDLDFLSTQDYPEFQLWINCHRLGG